MKVFETRRLVSTSRFRSFTLRSPADHFSVGFTDSDDLGVKIRERQPELYDFKGE